MSDNSYNRNTRIKIADLHEKNGIEDANLIIVEDKDDTKKSTVHELKKALSGDAFSPDTFKFYSSKKVQELLDMLNMEVSSKANSKDLEKIRDSITSIITSNGDGSIPTEVIEARDGYSTLGERLRKDEERYNSMYMRSMHKKTIGNEQYIEGTSNVDIIVSDTSSNNLTGILSIQSRNFIDFNNASYDNTWVLVGENTGWEKCDSKNGYSYRSHQVYIGGGHTISEDSITINFSAPPGSYKLYCSPEYDNSFNDSIRISIKYYDVTTKCVYDNQNSCPSFPITIDASKTISAIIFTVSMKNAPLVNSLIHFKDIMLLKADEDIPTKFIEYHKETINCAGKKNVVMGDFKNDYYIYKYTASRRTEQLAISHYDSSVTAEWFYDEINKLNSVIDDKLDKCGLITDYGIYQYMDNLFISNDEDLATIEWDEDYSRNGAPSKKITINSNTGTNPIMRLPLENQINIIENVGICFYMDRTDYSLFPSTSGGLKIRLCSDNVSYPGTVNYYEYLITKKEMVQGWNFIKKRIQDFTIPAGSIPNPNAIQYIYIEVCGTSELNGKSLYLNSVVFNQKMKPTVMLCFDGTWDTSVSWLYPFMQSRGVKGTIFLNQKRTLAPETVDSILKYKISHGWDIGLEGCHPNKETLIEDDNYRNQYMAILNGKEWLKNTITNSPIAFSAPFGNLRPLTLNIAKDMGIRIARTDANGYCAFFSDKDFSLPSHLIDISTTAESVIDKIDYAIETGQALILYTTDVSEYGGTSIAKKLIFEEIVNYISDRINDDERHIDCLTFREFYEKCIN